MDDAPSDSQFSDLVTRGHAMLELRDCREAYTLFRQATQLAPDSVVAWAGLGDAYVLCDELRAAIEVFQRAVILEPQDASLWARLGNALLRLRRFQEAVDAFDHALAGTGTVRPSSEGEAVEKGTDGAQRQTVSTDTEVDLELAALERAVLVDPGSAECWHWRGDALHKKGNDEAAIQAYDRALALWPPDAHRVNREFTWASKAVSLMQLHRYEDAIVACDQALPSETRDAVLWKLRGDALMQVGRHADAVASLERAVAVSPDFASAWRSLAAALKAIGRVSDAQEAERHAHDLPDDSTTPMIEIRF